MKEVKAFIKSLYKRNDEDFTRAIFGGLSYYEVLNNITGDTFKSFDCVERLLPKINSSLENKGYVMKKISTNPLTYDPVESPDFVVKSKGLRGFFQYVTGLLSILAYPAEIKVRGVDKSIYIQEKHKIILPEMEILAKELEEKIGKKVEISVI